MNLIGLLVPQKGVGVAQHKNKKQNRKNKKESGP
jgi:hypothetical protein